MKKINILFICKFNKDGEIYTVTSLDSGFSAIKNSTQTNLGQGVVVFDGFQAFDRNSVTEEAGELAGRVWIKLADRNNGGAFDLWRNYGNISSFIKNQLGSNDYESQGVAHVTVNENMNNLMPLYWINNGAGGYSVDFEGKDLGKMKLTDGRPNVILAANEPIKEKLLNLIAQCI